MSDPRESNFFLFFPSVSGCTSAVSTLTAYGKSAGCSSRLCQHIREASPCDKPLLVAAPAVGHWSCELWVGWMMTEVQSLSWDGTEGRKAVVPGCEENNKTTNWSLGLPAHVGGTLTVAIQISTEFWDTNFIIPHLLYCCNSLNSPLTQVFMLLCFYIKTKVIWYYNLSTV